MIKLKSLLTMKKIVLKPVFQVSKNSHLRQFEKLKLKKSFCLTNKKLYFILKKNSRSKVISDLFYRFDIFIYSILTRHSIQINLKIIKKMVYSGFFYVNAISEKRPNRILKKADFIAGNFKVLNNYYLKFKNLGFIIHKEALF